MSHSGVLQDQILKGLTDAQIDSGPLFRSLHLGRITEHALDTRSIRRLVKRSAVKAGLDLETAKAMSGHSMRVGAAQDMLVSGVR